VRMKTLCTQPKNSEESNGSNSEYFQNKLKREHQKQLNIKNATKINSEKSYSLSREIKSRREDDEEILTEAQNDKYDQENSLNNSVKNEKNKSDEFFFF